MPRVDRIDFTSEKRCTRCHRPLTLGIAHIVIEDDSTERPYGPWCAKRFVVGAVPDFTKGARYDEKDIEGETVVSPAESSEPVSDRSPTKSSPAEAVDGKSEADEKRQRVLTYLRLRQDRMRDFPRVWYAGLQAPYERARAGTLSDNDVERVLKLMASVERSAPLLSLQSLLTAYAYHRVLARAIADESPSNRRYLASLDEDLRRFLMLTKAQIAGANRWLHVQGKLELGYCPMWSATALHAAKYGRTSDVHSTTFAGRGESESGSAPAGSEGNRQQPSSDGERNR